jgi:hypothetical protein
MTPEDLIRSFLGSLTFGIDCRGSDSNIHYKVIYYVCKAITKISAGANKRRRRDKALCRKWSDSCPRPRSDIIKTILTPSNAELISLAVIVAIRITLSWSLSRELKTI